MQTVANIAPSITPLSPSCFTFIDTPRAIAERDGLTAKACRGRLKRRDRKGAKLAHKRQRALAYGRLVEFYGINADSETSPFSDHDVVARLAELIGRFEDDRNSYVEF